ncbi:hypothetical protein FACS1894137_15730 [Spirochaetia bacterium]|nr:hypothetical protein FACS1894137_15730 [Spirochaetia bacterium]
MKSVFLSGLIGLVLLFPAVAQQIRAVEGSASRYSSEDTVYYGSHASFPFGTQVIVTNLENNKQVTVQIGGRIPADSRWIIAISSSAADVLGMNGTGFTQVRVEEVPKAAKRKAVRKFMQTGPASSDLEEREFIAAHPSIPLNSWVRITNKTTGKQAFAAVTRRIPADGKRVIALSRSLARELGLGEWSVEEVMIETVDKDTRK